MRNTTENDTEGEWTGSENSEEDSEDDFEYEKLKRQVRRKHRVTEKQVMRRYLEGEDPDYIAIINGKIYGNLGGKIRKRRCRSFGFSDSGADVIRIKPNPLSLYGVGSEQEWRTFVNAFDNYWDVWDMYISDKHKIKKSSSYFKSKVANDQTTIKKQGIIFITQKKYVEYLYNIVADPANRRNNVYMKFKIFIQTDDQSVKDLRYTIKLLEKDISKQSEELEA